MYGVSEETIRRDLEKAGAGRVCYKELRRGGIE
ncbi:MAG: DeoR family transcriptional regulator [Eisenbergiella sp.]